jgi:hypothetical protein
MGIRHRAEDDSDLEPEGRLVCAIIRLALQDLTCRTEARRAAARAFFGSPDFELCCSVAKLNPGLLRDRLHIHHLAQGQASARAETRL